MEERNVMYRGVPIAKVSCPICNEGMIVLELNYPGLLNYCKSCNNFAYINKQGRRELDVVFRGSDKEIIGVIKKLNREENKQ